MPDGWPPRLRLQTTAIPAAYSDDGPGREHKHDWTPASSSLSPVQSDGRSERSLRDTPLTTPSSSPIKDGSTCFEAHLPRHTSFDGADEGNSPCPKQIINDLRIDSDDGGDESTKAKRHDGSNFAEQIKAHHGPAPSHYRSTDLQLLEEIAVRNSSDTEASPTEISQVMSDRANDVQRASALEQSASLRAADRLRMQRRPLELLRFRQQSVSPRRRKLHYDALDRADRFITSRLATPTKQDLFLDHSVKKNHRGLHHRWLREPPEDPFGPTLSSRLNLDNHQTTVRTSPGRTAIRHRPESLVTEHPVTSRRSISTGAVWTVGGATVTEGVASTTNGRGGRVTSGTSAPHYNAGFLDRQTPGANIARHGQRLAIAMDMTANKSVLTYSPSKPHLPLSSRIDRDAPDHVYWNDSAWERPSSRTPSRLANRKPKEIPIIPFRVLDAPALRDDYYCSLLAYSHGLQCLAVGLGPHVYLWAEKRHANRSQLPDSLNTPLGAHVTCLSFSCLQGGSVILAIGRADGRITLWSPLDSAPRFDSEQPSPISCLSFRPNQVKRASVREHSEDVLAEELLVGDEAGNVYLYSIEWPDQDRRDLFNWHGSMTLISRISCHTQQVCGIVWSRDGSHIATGGNDNQLYVFRSRTISRPNTCRNSAQAQSINMRNGDHSKATVPGQGQVLSITLGQQRHTFVLNAAVKAIAFAPWQHSLIAAGGGSNDRCIHFFHALSGATLATIDCHAQVTSLIWSEKRREIAATFGFAQPDHPYRVAVFTWPGCKRVVGIPWWNEERALYAIAYPGGPSSGQVQSRKQDAEGKPWYGRRTREEGCIVVATSDASIKFHEVWSEHRNRTNDCEHDDILGGSQILEDSCSPALQRTGLIR